MTADFSETNAFYTILGIGPGSIRGGPCAPQVRSPETHYECTAHVDCVKINVKPRESGQKLRNAVLQHGQRVLQRGQPSHCLLEAIRLLVEVPLRRRIPITK